MRTIVVNDTIVNDQLSVSLTPGQKYSIVFNTPVLVRDEPGPPKPIRPDTPPTRRKGEKKIDLQVRDKETNLPLSEVTVTLMYPDGFEEDAVTDHDGRIHIEGVGYDTVLVCDIVK